MKALVESSGDFEFDDGREMELTGPKGTHQVFEVNLPPMIEPVPKRDLRRDCQGGDVLAEKTSG